MQPREWLMLSMYILAQAHVLTGLSKNKQEVLLLTIKEVRRIAFYRIKHLQHKIYRIDCIKMKFIHLLRVLYERYESCCGFTGKDLNIMRTEGGQATGMPEQTGSTMPITS